MTRRESQPPPRRPWISPRLAAALDVLLVTLVWSSSSLLFKASLRTVPPLTLAAIQVALASVVLGALAWRQGELRRPPGGWPAGFWRRIAGMGLARYAVGQAAFILALAHLTASAAVFVSSFNSLAVLLLGSVFLREVPSRLQWLGTALAIIGAGIFFAVRLSGDEVLGIGFGLVNVLAFSVYNIIARGVGRDRQASNRLVTAASLACGAPLLVAAAWLVEGPPSLASLGLLGLVAVVWGGLLDTGLSLSLWNRALRVLWSFEVTILARAQMIEVPLLAMWLLGESVGGRQWLGIGVTLAGILLGQRRPAAPAVAAPSPGSAVQALAGGNPDYATGRPPESGRRGRLEG